MMLYLVQHGLAEMADVDPLRPLSAKGRRDVERMALTLGKTGLRVGAIRHSTKLRARQTAGLLAARLLRGGAAQEASGLAPNDPVEAWIPTLAVAGTDTMLVGHQPFMGRLVAELVCGRSSSPVLAFQPGMVAALERNGSDGWVLAWALPPWVLQ